MKLFWIEGSIASFAGCICTPLLYAYLKVNGPAWLKPETGEYFTPPPLGPLHGFCVLLALGLFAAGVYCAVKAADARE